MSKKPNDFVSANFKIRFKKWISIDVEQRLLQGLGHQAVKLIKARTKIGRQATGKHMPGYDDDYKKAKQKSGIGARRDSKLTGSLMRGLVVIGNNGKNTVTIGWTAGSSSSASHIKKGKFVQRPKRAKHHEIIKRLLDFGGESREILGLTKADNAKLRRWLRSQKKQIISKK